MPASPTARTLAELRKRGHIAGVVERWIQQARTRIDLFGCIDIVAIMDGEIVGIQCTSGSNHASHITKALAEPKLIQWLAAGGRYQVWSWRKNAKRRWVHRIEAIDYERAAAAAADEPVPEPAPMLLGGEEVGG